MKLNDFSNPVKIELLLPFKPFLSSLTKLFPMLNFEFLFSVENFQEAEDTEYLLSRTMSQEHKQLDSCRGQVYIHKRYSTTRNGALKEQEAYWVSEVLSGVSCVFL